jgi:hypothetical protein
MHIDIDRCAYKESLALLLSSPSNTLLLHILIFIFVSFDLKIYRSPWFHVAAALMRNEKFSHPDFLVSLCIEDRIFDMHSLVS